ncbi:hypothetical protein ACHWQZ_G017784 [Mnemiopsis leidyi]
MKIWDVLEDVEVVFQSFFRGTRSPVRINGQLTDWFDVNSGTGQGDIQGPPVFNFCLNFATFLGETNKTISQEAVLQKGDMEVEEKVIVDTDYADDMAILNNAKEGLQESTDLLAHYNSYAELKINAKKTQCMAVSKCASKRPLIRGDCIELSVGDLPETDSEDQVDLSRIQRSRIQRSRIQRGYDLRSAAADAICNTISTTTDSKKMFEAVRTLNIPKAPSSIGVHNEQGCHIATDTGKAAVVAKYLEQQLTRNEAPLEPFVGLPRPLVKPFTSEEIGSAARSLKNGRASGPDGIPNELLKYSTGSVHRRFADIINRCFETNSYLDPIGQANITPLQKPNKPIGPVKNLRPLTLSNAVRKILSMATLKRIENKVNAFTGPWQCAYKQGRSCADIVWCQRVMLSVVQRKRWEYHRMGIDMSSAFDTIRRSTILDLLVECGCDDDEIRLVRLLLSNTKLKVNVNGTLSAEFQSFLGAFQGDCLSGCLFTLVLAGALRDLRNMCT